MVAGLSLFTSERPYRNSSTKRCGYRTILPDGLRVGKKSVTDTVDICRSPPRMNALCAANLMSRRTVSAVCADKYRRVDLAPEVLQESGKQEDCARYVMRELA